MLRRPRKRAATTRASSLGFQQSSMIRSAIARGDPDTSREREKARPTPSVAMSSTSPVRRSSVALPIFGSWCPGRPRASASEPFARFAAGSALISRPSTLPTPSQVKVLSDAETKARLIAAPRVPFKAWWQRSTSGTSSPLGFSRSAAPATWAAYPACSPWPRPSIAATSTPSGRGQMTARSPLATSPRRQRVATPHSSGC